MYLSKVEIKNVRSISAFEMTFQSFAGWHVIIGDNGAGKSSLLKSIALGLVGLSDAVGWPEDFGAWVKKGAELASIFIELDWADSDIRKKNPYVIEIKDDTVKGQLGSSTSFFADGGIDRLTRAKNFSCAFGSYRTFKKAGSNQYLDIERINPIAGAHLSIFVEMAFSDTKNWLIQQQHVKLESNGNKSLIDDLKEFVNSNNILPAGIKLNRITAFDVLFLVGDNNEIGIEDLSEGYRSNLAIILEIVRQMEKVFGSKYLIETKNGKALINKEGVVLIDEVDAHLHPTWQTEVGKTFTAVFPKIQFIVSSHSPLICRASENGTIWRLALPGSTNPSGEITGKDKEKLIFGNVLDAYGTEVFGKSPVRSEKSDEKLKRLGKLNMLSAIGKINTAEERERLNLQQILTSDAPTGF